MKRKLIYMACMAAAISGGTLAQNAATDYTEKANEAVKEELDFANRKDFEDARKGFIATLDAPAIRTADGKVAYSLERWDFLQQEAPATVNPSLWRQSQLNRIHGLFEVVPGKVYQVRGFDIANMTFVRTDHGWVIIDVTCTNEAAKAGYDLIKKHVGDFPVKALVITHPHGDHFGGVDAIREGAPNKDFEIIAPKGFVHSAQSENVIAGVAMARRATYMFGVLLPPGETASVGSGLGQAMSAGTAGFAIPTKEIGRTGERLDIDGLEMEFVYVEETEAPVEIMIWFPQLKAFCTAEVITRNLHNLQTPRGAKVRNGLLWSKAIDTAIARYGSEVEVSFSTHHWPTWGNREIVNYWEAQRDLYRYLHDQTLHMANRGLTPAEIAEEMHMPQSLDTLYHCRNYYGTLSHNVKSQYDLYFGWFDGNPANLNPLPPAELGKKYVEAMGGAEQVMKIARSAFDKGEYRWVATLLNNLVFAQPDHMEARHLLADAYTQMGYQAESAPWRNFYLCGAKELREIRKAQTGGKANPLRNRESVALMDMDMLLDYCAIQLSGDKASGKEAVINMEFTDSGEKASLILKNGVLNHRLGRHEKNADLSLRIAKMGFVDLFFGLAAWDELQQAGKVSATGDMEALTTLCGCVEPSDPKFNIVLP